MAYKFHFEFGTQVRTYWYFVKNNQFCRYACLIIKRTQLLKITDTQYLYFIEFELKSSQKTIWKHDAAADENQYRVIRIFSTIKPITIQTTGAFVWDWQINTPQAANTETCMATLLNKLCTGVGFCSAKTRLNHYTVSNTPVKINHVNSRNLGAQSSTIGAGKTTTLVLRRSPYTFRFIGTYILSELSSRWCGPTTIGLVRIGVLGFWSVRCQQSGANNQEADSKKPFDIKFLTKLIFCLAFFYVRAPATFPCVLFWRWSRNSLKQPVPEELFWDRSR